MDASVIAAKKVELSAELRKARTWILVVAILGFTMDLIFIYAVYGDRLLPGWKTKLTLMSAGVFVFFMSMWWFARKKPKLCVGLALAGYWALQLYLASIDPANLTKGLLIKIFFTAALINGLKSAARAETLQHELSQVFE